MKEKNKCELITIILFYVIFCIPFGIKDLITINNPIIRYSYMVFLLLITY